MNNKLISLAFSLLTLAPLAATAAVPPEVAQLNGKRGFFEQDGAQLGTCSATIFQSGSKTYLKVDTSQDFGDSTITIDTLTNLGGGRFVTDTQNPRACGDFVRARDFQEIIQIGTGSLTVIQTFKCVLGTTTITKTCSNMQSAN